MADRSAHQLRTEIAEGWRTHEAGCPRSVRFDDWTDDHRRAYELKIVFEGMNYGFTGLRLSQAGEAILRSAESLAELADELLRRLKAKNDPVTTGYVADAINQMARERSAA